MPVGTMPVGILPVGTMPCTRNTGRPGKYGTVGILATLVTLCINDVIATRDFCTRVRAVAQNSPPIHSNWYYVILNSFKIARWSGWVWVGECFFWYRPTRVVPDQRPLNGRCCCCCFSRSKSKTENISYAYTVSHKTTPVSDPFASTYVNRFW